MRGPEKGAGKKGERDGKAQYSSVQSIALFFEEGPVEGGGEEKEMAG